MSASSLAANVRRARYNLRLTQQDVADRGGPSVASLRTIESGRSASLRGKTLRSLERAFGWPVGSAVAALFDGADPLASVAPSPLNALIAASAAAGRLRVLSGFSEVAS